MCGIAGFCGFKRDFLQNGDFWRKTLVEMKESIAHRGPDCAGEYLCEHAVFVVSGIGIWKPGSIPTITLKRWRAFHFWCGMP
jgi:asparagine synthase (glutamine-hydrolysing)